MVEADGEMEKLKKLDPEARIKKLKEMQERRKKDEETAQKMMKESEEELALEAKLSQVEIPDAEDVDIGKLFKKEEESLEESVADVRLPTRDDFESPADYFHALPTERIERQAEYLMAEIQDSGTVTEYQRQLLSTMYTEVNQREESLRHGSYKSTNKNIEEELSLTKNILKDAYKRIVQ